MLEVDMKTTIKTLYQKGYNKTQIGRMLGIDRKTVRKVLKEDFEQKDMEQERKSTTWPSMLDEYREYIEIQLEKDLSITRIHQDLQKEFGVECVVIQLYGIMWEKLETGVRTKMGLFY